MNEAEFDKFADEYHAMHMASITASGEGPEYFAEYKVRDLAREYARRWSPTALARSTTRVLDFGAGSGSSLPFAQHYLPGCEWTCLDVSSRSLRLAESRFGPLAEFVQFDGGTLPFTDASFDIVFAACVFHHIDHAEHLRLLSEWHRVLRPGGLALVYEHNPWNPLTRRVVNRCPFDENAHLITARAMHGHMRAAGFSGTRTRYRVFFPHALRWFRPLEPRMTGVPLGAQYYVAATR